MENIFIIDNPEKNRFKYWAKYLITVLDNVFYKIIVRKSNETNLVVSVSGIQHPYNKIVDIIKNPNENSTQK